MMTELFFWLCAGIIAYTYIGYPLVLVLLSTGMRRKVHTGPITPSASIMLSVYNEEAVIERKIQNLTALDYPSDKLEILIGSDGSHDRTDQMAARFVSPRVRFFPRQTRKGKISMLNDMMPYARGEIIVFTDARQILPADAVKAMVKNFADPSVGSASGELILRSETPGSVSESIGWYWKYEKWIRARESAVGSMLGATGAFYAVRKNLYMPPPDDILLDDMLIPLQIVRRGYRAVFDQNVTVYDEVASSMEEEAERKIRTLAGNWQLLFRFPSFFNPFSCKVGFQLISHKILRLIIPYLLVLIFITNIFILNIKFYTIIFVFQILFYVLAICGLMFPKLRIRLCNIPFTFCSLNIAAIKGLYAYLMKKQKVTWK